MNLLAIIFLMLFIICQHCLISASYLLLYGFCFLDLAFVQKVLVLGKRCNGLLHFTYLLFQVFFLHLLPYFLIFIFCMFKMSLIVMTLFFLTVLLLQAFIIVFMHTFQSVQFLLLFIFLFVTFVPFIRFAFLVFIRVLVHLSDFFFHPSYLLFQLLVTHSVQVQVILFRFHRIIPVMVRGVIYIIVLIPVMIGDRHLLFGLMLVIFRFLHLLLLI